MKIVYQCLSDMNWRVCILTYNVAMEGASEEAVDALLSPLENSHATLVIVGMQEVAHSETVGSATVTWQQLMLDWMTLRGGMVLLAKNYQATNQISIFAKKTVLAALRSIDFRFIRNTMGGLTGHKGSIGVKLQLRNDTSMVFVDSHFVHDVAAVDRRVAQYQSNRICAFPEDPTVRCVFWLGDLNFRVELEPAEAKRRIDDAVHLQMLDSDEQLCRLMRQKKVFLGFHEQTVSFKPTYRILKGSTEFDLKRTPSWCDRVLYKGSNVIPVSYDSLTAVVASDHHPVLAVFDVKVSPYPASDWDCIFEQLPTWYTTIPLIGRFQLRNNFWSRRGSYMDWVGVFPSSIVDCTSAIKWVWVATCYDQVVDEQRYIVCEFAPLPPGKYRLGYFSSYSRCLVGLSKSFLITEPPI